MKGYYAVHITLLNLTHNLLSWIEIASFLRPRTKNMTEIVVVVGIYLVATTTVRLTIRRTQWWSSSNAVMPRHWRSTALYGTNYSFLGGPVPLLYHHRGQRMGEREKVIQKSTADDYVHDIHRAGTPSRHTSPLLHARRNEKRGDKKIKIA